jgi:hypothetical protein
MVIWKGCGIKRLQHSRHRLRSVITHINNIERDEDMSYMLHKRGSTLGGARIPFFTTKLSSFSRNSFPWGVKEVGL